ncbi:cytochrome P450 [Coprinopsis marcescibilis]|uniref:Cytochrome P450 n=1 Tax=Coprinopsis marcescibilis TaxID=230819 RepID=A0A5C3LLF2_COPMA|nr:cytochrome P450 [Coprinopsis marcescibilis]
MSPTAGQVLGASFLAWALWRILKQRTTKSPLDNLDGPAPKSFLKGSFSELVNPHAWDYHIEVAEKYGSVFKFSGYLGQEALYAFDPKALHHILIKDTDVFHEMEAFLAGNKIVFGEGLLATDGDKHRKQRKMINPVFSINHMREMVPTFYEVMHKLRDGLDEELQGSSKEIDMLSWVTRTSLELIGQSGLGHSFDSLKGKDGVHPYCTSAKTLIEALGSLNFTRNAIVPLVHNIGSPKFRRTALDFISLFWPNVKRLRDIVDVMDQTSLEIFNAKKKALLEGNDALEKHAGRGKDLISILMKANMEANEEDKLPDAEVLGQMTTITFAAMDTTSNSLSRILHILGENPEAQERLRKEILDAEEEHGQLDHDALVHLPFLDAVLRETLRLYPALPLLAREARSDGILPLHTPVKGVNGEEISEIFVPKGMTILISVLAANRNRELWGPDVHEWKPERWLAPIPDAVVKAKMPGVYSHLMTFFGGGRACIGFKFAQLEMKVALAVLLKNYKFECQRKDILWEMTGIPRPVIKTGGSLTPQLPLKVTPLHAAPGI